MSCENMRREELAESGWTEDEITTMEREVELARAKANAEVVRNGGTKSQSERAMEIAGANAKRKAHGEFHARLDRMMDDILALGEAIEPVPAHVHAGTENIMHESGGLNPAARAKLATLLGGGDDD